MAAPLKLPAHILQRFSTINSYWSLMPMAIIRMQWMKHCSSQCWHLVASRGKIFGKTASNLKVPSEASHSTTTKGYFQSSSTGGACLPVGFNVENLEMRPNLR